MRRYLAALSVASLTAACVTEPPVERPADGIHPAIIEVEGRPGAISVPAIVTAGEPFIVIIETFGGPGLANAPGYVEVSRNGSTLVLQPFDDYTSRPVPSFVLTYEHEVELLIEERGTFEVRVVARRDRGYAEISRSFPVSVR